MIYTSDELREREAHLIASCQDRMLAEAGETLPCCGNCDATFPVTYRDETGELAECEDFWCDEHGWIVCPDAPACERHRER